MFPVELVIELSKYLDIEDLVALGYTCQSWKAAIPDSVYQLVMLRHCPTFTPESTFRSSWQECAQVHVARSKNKSWNLDEKLFCLRRQRISVANNAPCMDQLDRIVTSTGISMSVETEAEQKIAMTDKSLVLTTFSSLENGRYEVKMLIRTERDQDTVLRYLTVNKSMRIYPFASGNIATGVLFERVLIPLCPGLDSQAASISFENFYGKIRKTSKMVIPWNGSSDKLIWYDGLLVQLKLFPNSAIKVCRYDTTHGTKEYFDVPTEHIWGADISRDQRLVLFKDEQQLVSKIWDLRTKQMHSISRNDRRAVTTVGFSEGKLSVHTFDEEYNKQKVLIQVVFGLLISFFGMYFTVYFI